MNGPNNAIKWCDYTWTPITGCARNCWYCYVKRIKGYDRTPKFHPERLEEPLKLKKPAKIFVCSTADIFGEWVMEDWVRQVIDIIKRCPQHQFQILTKSVERIANFTESLKQPNIWLGVTVEHRRFLSRLKVLQFIARQYELKQLFVSFEPLLSNIALEQLEGIGWVIIGAYTGKDAELLQPKPEWVKNIMAKAEASKIPVFLKDNLKIIWDKKLRQEWPMVMNLTKKEEA